MNKQSALLRELLQSDDQPLIKTGKKNPQKSKNNNNSSSSSSNSPEDEEEKIYVLKKESKTKETNRVMQRNEVLMKIIVVGEPGVGKTSLIHKFVDANYILPNNFYKPTIGVDFYRKEFRINDKYVLVVFFWDVAGQERFIHMTRSFYNEALAAIVVFSLADKKTLNFSRQWKKDIDQKVFINPSLLQYLKKISTNNSKSTTNSSNTIPNKRNSEPIPAAKRTMSNGGGSGPSSMSNSGGTAFLLQDKNNKLSNTASSASENQSTPSTPPGDEEDLEVVVPVVLFGNKLDMYLNNVMPQTIPTTSLPSPSNQQSYQNVASEDASSTNSLRKLIVANASAIVNAGSSDMSPAYAASDPNNAFPTTSYQQQMSPASSPSQPSLQRMNSFVYKAENNPGSQKEPSPTSTAAQQPELRRSNSFIAKEQLRKEKIGHIEEKMQKFVEENGFSKFFPMSAKTGYGVSQGFQFLVDLVYERYLKAVVLNNMKNEGNGGYLGNLLDNNNSNGKPSLLDDDLDSEDVVRLANSKNFEEKDNDSWKCCG